MMNTPRKTILAALALTVALASGCGSSGSSSTSTAPSTTPPSGTGQVLPVPGNPISNTSTAAGLTITKVLVENNVSADTGKAADDHLEITLANITTKPLDRIAIYYKITDPTKGTTEGYYTKLDGFRIPPGTSRVVHFDNTGAAYHYPVNKYSLYYTGKNKLRVDVFASSPTAKVATFTVRKDAAGAEAGIE
jgi:hypothetical protein